MNDLVFKIIPIITSVISTAVSVCLFLLFRRQFGLLKTQYKLIESQSKVMEDQFKVDNIPELSLSISFCESQNIKKEPRQYFEFTIRNKNSFSNKINFLNNKYEQLDWNEYFSFVIPPKEIYTTFLSVENVRHMYETLKYDENLKPILRVGISGKRFTLENKFIAQEFEKYIEYIKDCDDDFIHKDGQFLGKPATEETLEELQKSENERLNITV